MSVTSDSKQRLISQKSEWGWPALVAWCLVLVVVVGAAVLLVG